MGLLDTKKWLSLAVMSLFAVCLAGTAAASQEYTKVSGELKIGDSFTPGQKIEADIMVKMDHGFHINCDADQKPMGMPLSVTLEAGDNLEIDKVIFPVAKMIKMTSAEKPIPVFEGEVTFKVKMGVAQDAPKGKHKAMLIMEYQGCEDNMCHMPELMEMPFEYEIK